MYAVVSDHVFPFLRTLGGDDSTYAHHMKDARFTIPTPSLLAKVVDMLDNVPMEDRDTKGDLYEYMLAKIGSMNMLLHGVENPQIHHRTWHRRGRAIVRVAVHGSHVAWAGRNLCFNGRGSVAADSRTDSNRRHGRVS